MNIIIILFLITGIINIVYLSNKRMHIAKNVYVLSLLIMVLLFCFISDSVVIKFITYNILPSNLYEFVSSALNTPEYVSTYLLLLMFITEIQLLCSMFIINYKLCAVKHTLSKSDSITFSKRKNIFNTVKEEDNNLCLSKVYKGFCKMLN